MSYNGIRYIYYRKGRFFSETICLAGLIFSILYGDYNRVALGQPVPWDSLAFLLIPAFILCKVFQRLCHRGPLYIISSEGITDSKYGHVSWQEVADIKVKKVIVSFRPRPYFLGAEYVVVVTLRDPKEYFGGNIRSLFGKRTLRIFSEIMFYKDDRKDRAKPFNCFINDTDSMYYHRGPRRDAFYFYRRIVRFTSSYTLR